MKKITVYLKSKQNGLIPLIPPFHYPFKLVRSWHSISVMAVSNFSITVTDNRYKNIFILEVDQLKHRTKIFFKTWHLGHILLFHAPHPFKMLTIVFLQTDHFLAPLSSAERCEKFLTFLKSIERKNKIYNRFSHQSFFGVIMIWAFI